MLIRPATLEDAPALGRVHVQAWHETYRGIMPDSMLERMRADERAKSWAERIPSFPENRQSLMVAIDAGELIGFAGCGPTRTTGRSTPLGSDGEIYMINIVNRGKRRRVGARLMLAMANALESNRFATAGLWVLEKNLNARTFYARLGGTPGAISEEEHDGVMLTDLAILWPRIATLRERADEVLANAP